MVFSDVMGRVHIKLGHMPEIKQSTKMIAHTKLEDAPPH
jgi:hypothetical protein